MEMTPVDLDSLSNDELKERHLDLLQRHCELKEQVMALKDELALLKGGKSRPQIKPSGMEQSSENTREKAEGRTAKTGRGRRNHRLQVTQERIVKLEGLPQGQAGGLAAGEPVQGLPGQPHPGAGDAPSGDPGATRTVADTGPADPHRAIPGRAGGRVRPCAQARRAGPLSPGSDDLGPAGPAARRPGAGDLQAHDRAPPDRGPGRSPRRGESGPAGRTGQRLLDHGSASMTPVPATKEPTA